ncbi:Uu.00g119400.m01.CDS01 [Anthostomella pinea]|uniref:Uu.00g119400.m01.CDS01 n=1 Tax=Anthostomella pinea TaxID=933095 RepID=A0AAI8YH50_9PEZI|nr:Uu.00g119400.m01.CDS01 [Anthostomella pinea]
MAYNGAYADRPYAGSAARAPRGPGGSYPPPPPQRQYDQYQQDDYGYGYDQYDDGYGQDYGPPPPQDMNYGRGGPQPNQGYPQQDMYRGHPGGRGGRPPGSGGRGGPVRGPRGGPAPGPGRGYPAGGPGRPAPFERSASAGPNARRAPPMSNPNEHEYGSPYPALPGQHRKSDIEEEGQILDRMAGMSVSERPGPGPGPVSGRSPGPGQGPRRQATMEDYGRPSMDSQRGGRGPPPQGYPGPRRGPPPQEQGYGGYRDDGYGAPMSAPRDGFGPPPRSMTMPAQNDHPMNNGMPPPRTDSGGYNGPPGRNIPPPRPSTAQGSRPTPHRVYPDQAPPMPTNNAGLYPPGYGEEPDRASFGDFYDTYYDQRGSGDQYHQGNQQRHDIPDFDAASPAGRSSLDQHMRPPQAPPQPQPGMPQPGPARFPEMSRTKTQPNLREPQAAVFEMASDLPPVPSGGFQAYKPGLPANPGPNRVPQGSPPQVGPGSGHPAPYRPGLMQNSMASVGSAKSTNSMGSGRSMGSMNEKPAPVRNYNGGTPPAAAGAQGRPQAPPQDGRPSSVAEQPPVTVEELERLRAHIKNDPNDQKSALVLAKKLIEAADVLVPRLPDPKARARSRERYVMDAHKILKKLVSAQNPDAMFFLADCMGRGVLGYEPDSKEAFTLYQSAAKLGHPSAAYRTAVCCELGNDDGGGTRKDPLKAIQWYKRAATLGDTPAMYKVGMILLKGLLGQPKNPREAVGWLKRAAERADTENPHALHELGLLFESAQPYDAIVRDEAYALQLFEDAAQLGYKFSQFRLGCAFEYALMGCPVDPRLSIMWYSRAATQEEHQSELALSGWYLTGSEGVLQQSDTEAYLWARKAAQAGLAKAEYAMGYFTEVGIGVPANMEDAKRWYWRAAAQDFPKARERLEDLKRSGKSGPRPRERISRSKIGKQQEGECSVM